MPATPYQRSILLIAVCTVLFLSFFIMRPLLTPILSGVLLTYLFHPVYAFLLKQRWVRCCPRSEKLARLLVLLIIVLILLAPIFTLLLLLLLNMPGVTALLRSFFSELNTFSGDLLVLANQGPLSGIAEVVDPKSFFNALSSGIFGILKTLLAQLPHFMLGSFITLFLVYYLLRDATRITAWVVELIPLKKKQVAFVLQRFNGLGRGLIASQWIIAIVQATLTVIACLILQVGNPLVVFLLTLVFAIIPFMGAIVVWASIALFLFFGFNHGVVPLWKPVFMLVYGSLLISTIDNFIRPKMLSDAAEINPAIILVGFIGGFALFGIPGVFIGPLILGLVELAIEIYKEVA